MKKIETLEQLHAEQQRLRAVAKQMEAELSDDFNYFSKHIQPFLSIFDKVKGGAVPMVWNVVSSVVPFIIRRFKKSKEEKRAESEVYSSDNASTGWSAFAATAFKVFAESELSKVIMSRVASAIASRMNADDSKDNEKES